jgi:hypothetical protein
MKSRDINSRDLGTWLPLPIHSLGNFSFRVMCVKLLKGDRVEDLQLLPIMGKMFSSVV